MRCADVQSSRFPQHGKQRVNALVKLSCSNPFVRKTDRVKGQGKRCGSSFQEAYVSERAGFGDRVIVTKCAEASIDVYANVNILCHSGEPGESGTPN